MGYLKDTVKGLSWMGGFRVFSRLIALGRTAILARILLPSQFGVYGIAVLVLAFLEIFSETGINIFLIQEKKDIDKYINTAWVLSILRGILIALIIILLAPVIASFFSSPEARSLILLISLVPMLRGLINPSIVKFQKELQFNREFWLRSSIFLLDSVVAVIVALITRSATSLIWGLAAGAALEVFLSFIFIKPTPKLAFEFSKVKKIIGRGKWITISGIFTYLSQQGDDAVVAKVLNAGSLGLYQMAYKLSTLPLSEVTQIAGKVTFPVYVRIADDFSRLKKAFYKTALATTFLIMPFGLVLFIFPKEIVLLILGSKWLGAVEVLRILAIFGVIRAISAVPNTFFLALKKQNWVAYIHFLRFLGLAVSIVPLTIKLGMVGAATAAIVSSVVALPLIFYYLSKALRK